MRLSRRLKHAANGACLRALVGLAGVVPRPLVSLVFGGVGWLGYHLFGRDRARIDEHVARAMPGLRARERRAFARRVFVELGRNAADVFRFVHAPPAGLLDLVEVEGEGQLEAARAGGRGVVVVTGHLGAWELLAGYFAQRGYRVAVLARRLKYPRLEAMLARLRARLGVEVVPQGGDMRAVFRTLKAGGLVGLVVDQDRRSPGVWVPFFGRPARVPVGPAELARRTGARLLAMGIRRAGGRHRITVLPPVEVDWEREGAEAAVMAGLMRSIESLVWRSPEQWTWMYDPWSPATEEVSVEGRGGGEVRSGQGEAAGPARRASLGGVLGALLVAVAAGSGLVAGCGAGGDRPGQGTASRVEGQAGREAPDQEITDFVLRETGEGGRLEWILRAATARIFEARDEVEADRVHIDFYDPAGAVNSVLTSDRGVITRRTNDMRAMGHVQVRNREGHELTTEELTYAAERRKIVTDQFVQIVRGRDVLTGYGLETDPDLEHGQFEIQRDVRATVREEPDGAPGAPEGARGAEPRSDGTH